MEVCEDEDNLSIKTDSTGNRQIVIKSNNSDLSKNQSKLLSLKKPIIKRKVPGNSSTFFVNSDDQQQGKVALKLLGDFIKKPPQNDAKQKTNNDRPILSRLKF